MKSFIHKYWPQVVIVSLWLIFSFPYVARGLIPFPSDYLVTFFPPWSAEYGMPVKNNAIPDVITQIYPWKKLTIDTWKSGQVPLWNPYSFAGTPHAGNYQSAVFSPLNLLFFILPFIDAWAIFILLQPLLAGVFMYMFVRSLDRSRAAALLSATAFMFCGFIVSWMAYGTLGYAALFLPLIFWGINKKKGLAISLGVALSFVSGHFQVSTYVLAAAAFYSIWKREWKACIYLALGVFIAAPQIFLGFKSFLLSTRGETVLKGEVIPWAYLLTLIAPDFFGNPVTRNDWFGHYAEWGGFVGVVPFLLAVFAGVRRKTPATWFFVALAVLAFAFALPTPFNSLLYILKVPVLSGSAASRIIILASFAIAVLSGFGLDHLVRDWKDNKRKQIIWFAVACFAFGATAWAILLFGNPLPIDKLAIAKRNFVLPSALIVAGSVFFVLGLVRRKWLQALVICLILGASAFDGLRFAIKWMPFESRQYVYPEVKSLEFLQSKVGSDRVFGNMGAGEVGVESRIPLIEGYDAVYPARYGEFISAVSKGSVNPGERSVVQFDKYGVHKTEALQLLGVRYIYHRLSDARNVWAFPYWEYVTDGSMRQIYSDEKYWIYEYTQVYPRAFLASVYTVATDPQETVSKLFAEGFDRRNTLVLEEKPSLEPQPASPAGGEGSASATIVSYTPNKVVIETNSEVAKLLFLSDTFDTGWKATVDGVPTNVYRADYDFRAVPVPAGAHTVIFTYTPDEFRWGIMLAIVGVVTLGYLLKQKK